MLTEERTKGLSEEKETGELKSRSTWDEKIFGSTRKRLKQVPVSMWLGTCERVKGERMKRVLFQFSKMII